MHLLPLLLVLGPCLLLAFLPPLARAGYGKPPVFVNFGTEQTASPGDPSTGIYNYYETILPDPSSPDIGYLGTENNPGHVAKFSLNPNTSISSIYSRPQSSPLTCFGAFSNGCIDTQTRRVIFVGGCTPPTVLVMDMGNWTEVAFVTQSQLSRVFDAFFSASRSVCIPSERKMILSGYSSVLYVLDLDTYNISSTISPNVSSLGQYESGFRDMQFDPNTRTIYALPVELGNQIFAFSLDNPNSSKSLYAGDSLTMSAKRMFTDVARGVAFVAFTGDYNILEYPYVVSVNLSAWNITQRFILSALTPGARSTVDAAAWDSVRSILVLFVLADSGLPNFFTISLANPANLSIITSENTNNALGLRSSVAYIANSASQFMIGTTLAGGLSRICYSAVGYPCMTCGPMQVANYSTQSCSNTCQDGYYSSQCVPCPGSASNPCSGHGVCDDGYFGSGSCSCDSGWTGESCGVSTGVAGAVGATGSVTTGAGGASFASGNSARALFLIWSQDLVNRIASINAPYPEFYVEFAQQFGHNGLIPPVPIFSSTELPDSRAPDYPRLDTVFAAFCRRNLRSYREAYVFIVMQWFASLITTLLVIVGVALLVWLFRKLVKKGFYLDLGRAMMVVVGCFLIGWFFGPIQSLSAAVFVPDISSESSSSTAGEKAGSALIFPALALAVLVAVPWFFGRLALRVHPTLFSSIHWVLRPLPALFAQTTLAPLRRRVCWYIALQVLRCFLDGINIVTLQGSPAAQVSISFLMQTVVAGLMIYKKPLVKVRDYLIPAVSIGSDFIQLSMVARIIQLGSGDSSLDARTSLAQALLLLQIVTLMMVGFLGIILSIVDFSLMVYRFFKKNVKVRWQKRAIYPVVPPATGSLNPLSGTEDASALSGSSSVGHLLPSSAAATTSPTFGEDVTKQMLGSSLWFTSASRITSSTTSSEMHTSSATPVDVSVAGTTPSSGSAASSLSNSQTSGSSLPRKPLL